jgi:hypothetical protein
MNKSKLLLFFILIFVTISYLFANFNQNLNLEAEEIYVKIYPTSKYLKIIEYNILSTETNIQKNIEKIQRIKNLVSQNKYCKEKFKFKYFNSAEEEMVLEKRDNISFIKGSYDLVTSKNDDWKDILENIFSTILNRPVEVNVTAEKITLVFDGEDIKVSQNNGLGIFKKETKRSIIWKKSNDFMDVVFSVKTQNHTNIKDLFGDNVKSPEKSKEEIDNIKQSSPKLNSVETQFQKDADIYRLMHLKYYGSLIEEYYQKNQKYPFQDKEKKPIEVIVAHKKQEKYANPKNNPNNPSRYSMKEFVQELEKGLNREINEYYDPQYIPIYKPNFYIYTIQDGVYYFAVHVSQSFSFSHKVLDNYYKVEITNNTKDARYGILFSELIKNDDFIKIIETVPSKESFFMKREEKYLKFTKK